MKECNLCGKCCTHYSDGGLSATADEIEWWQTFRPEIARYVSNGKIWMNPASGQQLKRCPWLQHIPNTSQYSCDIYHDRPDDCRHYPVDVAQMIEDQCEMLEVRDLAKPKQAQLTLDKLMTDSRPAVS